MYKKTVEKTCEITGAKLIVGTPDAVVHTFCIDTRKLEKGATFVCFAGEKTDGNRYVCEAFQKGASCVVMTRQASAEEKECASQKGAVLLRAHADSALSFLQAAARFYRQEQGWRVVGITGSSGKTTTREMMSVVLGQSFKTFSNEGNFNSAIGVPLTILNAPDNQEVFVCEIGMNRPGEIDEICACAQPDIGCILNIGTAHIGELGSRENIARAKAEMIPWLKHALFLNAADDFALFMREKAQAKTNPEAKQKAIQEEAANLEFKSQAPEQAATNLQKKQALTPFFLYNFAEKAACEAIEKEHETISLYAATEKVRLSENGQSDFVFCLLGDGSRPPYSERVHCPLFGSHMVLDALFALAVGAYLGVDLKHAAKAIAGMKPFEGRAQIKVLASGLRVIDDTYNANPASVCAALDLLAKIDAAGTKIAVIGEMGELGLKADELHRKCGFYAAQKGFDVLVFVGADNARALLKGAQTTTPSTSAPRMVLVKDARDANEALSSILKGLTKQALSESVVLVKGSRFMKLEEVTKELCATC